MGLQRVTYFLPSMIIATRIQVNLRNSAEFLFPSFPPPHPLPSSSAQDMLDLINTISTETAAKKASSAAGLSASETKGKTSQIVGEAKGKAAELKGEAKAKAAEGKI
jgi:hypothetical protein